MSDPLIISSDPIPGQRITDLHCWIATYADGTEGIIAGGLSGVGVAPLLSSRRKAAEALEGKAREAQRAVMHQTKHRIVSIRLVTFTSTEGTRQ